MLATYTFTPALKMVTLLLTLKRDKLLHFSELFRAGVEAWLIRCRHRQEQQDWQFAERPFPKPYLQIKALTSQLSKSAEPAFAVLTNADQRLDNLVGASHCMA